MVGNGRALIDLAPAGRGASDVEKRTNQLRLPCVAMSNDRKVANCFGGVDFHKSERVLSEIELRRQSSLRFSLMKINCDCGLSDNLAEPEREWQVRVGLSGRLGSVSKALGIKEPFAVPVLVPEGPNVYRTRTTPNLKAPEDPTAAG